MNNFCQYIRRVAFVLCICFAAVLIPGRQAAYGETSEGYLSVTGPCQLEFPRDHGAHPGYRTEWWYYTGNLQTAQQRSFGFQLTIFRRQISPPEDLQNWPDPVSRWRTQQIYLGHAAVTDIENGKHVFAETIARGALGLSGVRLSDGRSTVFLNDWSIDIGPETHRLRATTADFDLDLTLKPDKEPVMHGDGGYSRKGDGIDRASCYYSITRLQTAGTIGMGEDRFVLTGSSWMDHEYSTASLQPGISGWDWFSLQLDNQTDVMIYLLRREDGSLHPASSGTLVDASGRTTHLRASDFKVDVQGHWKSPQSAVRYPSGWSVRIDIDRHSIDLAVDARLPNQELQTDTTTAVTYWEGSVSAAGTAGGLPVKGMGYVELTGYDKGLDALR